MNILKKSILIITVLTSSVVVLGASNTASAALFDGSKGEACKGANLDGGNADCKSGDAAGKVEGVIQFIINLLSVIVGIVAVILIIVNGLKFITSGGDSNKISSARSGVIYAIVGLIIAALAQVLVRFVINKV